MLFRSHLLHACARNIDLTVIMANNYIYGMTGGQKSPSTPKGTVTKTSPFGSIDEPIDGCKLAISMGATYVARWTTAHPVQLEKSIAQGIAHKGFSFIEVLCQCPVQAGKTVYGQKDPARILRMYKEKTYQYRKGMEIPRGKIRIGVLKQEQEAKEYLEKVREKLLEQGVIKE